jgi:hypothetical protein
MIGSWFYHNVTLSWLSSIDSDQHRGGASADQLGVEHLDSGIGYHPGAKVPRHGGPCPDSAPKPPTLIYGH